ncbi:MAG TPA: RNB domain-containing ribonuclease [Bryobacteraceae bacterium]|nr:RNB domain-containing ribonuclease [Bryobacteraceae bacterium]
MSDRHFDLGAMAHQEMLAEGFHPDFPPAVVQQVKTLQTQSAAAVGAAGSTGNGQIRDLRSLLWSSIDNDTSRDLDQAEVAESVNGGIRVMIAVADVDADVPMGSPADQHAASETTSVYTGVRTFPMLPEALSTDLTSLNEGVDRLAIVIDMLVATDGTVTSHGIYRAVVRNQAQLTYNGVGAWLEGGAAPPKVAASADLAAQLKLQDEAAQILLAARHKLGALTIDREETEAVVADGQVQGIETRQKNRASDLIENFMVAANGVMARTLSAAGVSSIRRVVRTPERWPRIVELAARYGETLPAEPDSGALNAFLQERKAADGVHYADLALAVVKLMGPGEYVLSRAGDTSQGHFALAAHDYTHSTAPNRRFADTVTQRLIKSVIGKTQTPYSDSQLDSVARNCTLKEDAARKVERVMNKRIAAVVLLPRIGETFAAVVTGVTPKGTFVRVLSPHAEGLLIHGQQGVDVGDQLQVKLVSADPRRGYIDFAR